MEKTAWRSTKLSHTVVRFELVFSSANVIFLFFFFFFANTQPCFCEVNWKFCTSYKQINVQMMCILNYNTVKLFAKGVESQHTKRQSLSMITEDKV